MEIPWLAELWHKSNAAPFWGSELAGCKQFKLNSIPELMN